MARVVVNRGFDQIVVEIESVGSNIDEARNGPIERRRSRRTNVNDGMITCRRASAAEQRRYFNAAVQDGVNNTLVMPNLVVTVRGALIK